MGENSTIQWTDKTWNPWHGCTKVSDGCKFCYMYRDKERYGQDPKTVLRSKTTFNAPLKWTDPAMVFTCSWSDWFITDADEWRPEAWDIIRKTPHLTYQILTKRPENIKERLPADWGKGYPNVWLGVSVENQKAAEDRIFELLSIRAAVRFLSVEPLLGPIKLTNIPTGLWTYGQVDVMSGYLCGDEPDEMFDYDSDPTGWTKNPVGSWDRGPHGMDWVIIGGESGNETGRYRYRPITLEAIRSVVDQCQAGGVPVFVKQLGTHLAKELGLKDSHGGNMSEWPKEIQVRQFPEFERSPA